MLTFSPTTRILVSDDEVTFIGGIDHLAQVCREVMGDDPMSGTVFVFRNSRHTMVRVLYYDGQGFVLTTKRLSSGRFRFWVKDGRREIASRELTVLLWAGNPDAAKFAEDWRGVRTRTLPRPPLRTD